MFVGQISYCFLTNTMTSPKGLKID